MNKASIRTSHRDSILMLVFFLCYTLEAWFGIGEQDLQTAIFPSLIGMAGVFTSFLQLFQSIRRPVEQITAKSDQTLLGPVMWVCAFIALVAALGLLVATLLTIPVFLYRVAGLRPVTAVSIALCQSLVIYLLFDRVLGFQLPQGLLM